MMGRLPDFIDPIRLAKRGEYLVGQMDLRGMDRLLSMLVSEQGMLDVQLAFDIDNAGIRNIRGLIQTDVTVTCQRCLKPMDYVLEADVMLGIIKHRDQAEKLPDCYEPLLIETDEVSLRGIVEDELILAMPATPMHDEAECQCQSIDAYKKHDTDTADNAERKNPFAILADLKQELKDK